MRPQSSAPTCKHHRFSLLLSVVALGGVLGSTTGCPAKSACPPCYLGGVMANTSTTTTTTTTPTAPKSAVYLQLDSSNSKEKVSEVKVVLSDGAGGTETLTYSGDKVTGITSTSLTSIADSELYSINGKPPTTAEVELTFSSGKSTGPMTIPVKPETTSTRTTTTPTGAQ